MDEPPQAIEPAAEQAAAGEDAGSHLREDGTLVINILVEPPCGASSEGEIVVCAPGQSPYRYDPPPEPPTEGGPRPEIQLGEKTKLRARAETDARTGTERLMIDLVYKF